MNKKQGVSPRAFRVGGNANNGTNAGLAYLNSNNSPSNTNANNGSRLYTSYVLAHPRVGEQTGTEPLPLGKKYLRSDGAGSHALRIGERTLYIGITEAKQYT